MPECGLSACIRLVGGELPRGRAPACCDAACGCTGCSMVSQAGCVLSKTAATPSINRLVWRSLSRGVGGQHAATHAFLRCGKGLWGFTFACTLVGLPFAGLWELYCKQGPGWSGWATDGSSHCEGHVVRFVHTVRNSRVWHTVGAKLLADIRLDLCDGITGIQTAAVERGCSILL